MSCSLDRNKVSQAAQEKVEGLLEDSKLFNKEGDVWIPSEGTDWQKHVKDINDQFKGEVLKIDEGNVFFSPSENVIDRYILSQEGSGEYAHEMIAEAYKNQFSESGLNLLMGDKWLNHPMMENPTVKNLVDFALKINPNFQIGFFEGKENATSLIRDHIIMVRESQFIDELPEEVAHFFTALLPEDHPLLNQMMKDILNFPIYGKTYELYKNDPSYQKDGRPDVEKIKKEAIGKLIGEYIKNAFEEKADEAYGNKRGMLRDFVDKVMKFIRKAFYKLSGRLYEEPVISDDAFKQSADMIVQGDTSLLDLNKTISPYDSLFHSKMEENKAETFEGSRISKTLHTASKALKITIKKRFFDYIEMHDLKGLKEALSSEDYNRVWDVMHLLGEAEKDFATLSDQENVSLQYIGDICDKLKDAYHELEEIPKAMEKILAELRKDEKNNKLEENELVNNIREIEHYLTLSKTFETISKQFVDMLHYIQTKEEDFGDEYQFFKGTYDKMIADMGSTSDRFARVDTAIFDLLKKHLLNLTDKWTNKVFQNFTSETKELFDKAETDRRKKQLIDDLNQNFTSRDQLLMALNGKFPNREEMMKKYGRTFDLSKIKDLSNTDYMIFMFGATSTMSDPFVSNAIAFYVDKHLEASIKSREEQIGFGKVIMPIMRALKSLGVNYYDAQDRIQSVDKFYDPLAEDKTFERRTLLSQMKRFDFQYELQQMQGNVDSIQHERTDLQRKHDAETDDQKKDELKNQLTEVNKKLSTAKEELNDFTSLYSNRDYTDEFYEKLNTLRDNKTDSQAYSELKGVERKLITLMDKLNEAISNQISPQEYKVLTDELSALQARKLELKDKLPAKEKESYKMYEELYEEDEKATNRVVTRHKRAFVRRYIRYNRERITNNPNLKKLTDTELEKLANDFYTWTHTRVIPNEKFWNARKDIYDKISELSGKTNNYTKILAERQTELEEKRRKLLGSIRNFRNEVSVFALQNNTLPNSTKMIYTELADIDEELSNIRSKVSLLSGIQSAYVRAGKAGTAEDIAKKFSISMDVISAFESIIRQGMSEEVIAKTLGHYFDVTKGGVSQIKALLENVKNDPDTDPIKDIIPLLKPKGPEGKFALGMLKNIPLNQFDKKETLLKNALRDIVSLDETTSNQIQELYKQASDLSTQQVSVDYIYGPLLAIQNTVKEMRSLDENSPLHNVFDKSLLDNKFAKNTKLGLFENSEEVENFLSDGVLDQVVAYLRAKGQSDPNDDESEKMADFLQAIHTTRRVGEQDVTTPRSFLKNYTPNDTDHYDESYVNFLTRNKVRDQFHNEKIKETDPRVQAGTHKATVDINGHWLPREQKTVKGKDGKEIPNKFWNQQYEDMKNSSDPKDKHSFDMLQKTTQFYLQRQESMVPEGSRMDLVLPSRHNDEWEGMLLHMKGFKEWGNHIKEFFNGNKDTTDINARNYNEELGIVTKENRDIYNAAIIGENSVKLGSRRKMPIQRVSKDVLAGMMYFINDTNEYAAKNYVAPIFKAFGDAFHDAYMRTGEGNEMRAKVFQDLLMTKFYDEIPKNFGNNPQLARFLRLVNNFATRKLMGDPLGAMVNLIGGELQALIEANFDRKELAEWAASGVTATSWALRYTGDMLTQENLSFETQFANAFAMIPEETDLAHRMSKQATLASVRKHLMLPRTATEVGMGIQIGLTVLRTIPIEQNGVRYKFEDIYELNKANGLLELKPQFQNDPEMVKKYNLRDGSEVVQARRKIVQKYTLIQGNFYRFNQDYLSTMAVGKSVELMKRWFISSYTRRFQGRVLDPMLGTDRIGNHLALIQALKEFIAAVNPFNKDASMKTLRDFWMTRRKSDEVALRRSLAEIGYIMATGLFLTAVLGYNDDDKDKAAKVRQMNYWQQIMLLIAIRANSEIGTTVPLPMWGLGMNEVKRAFFDPISTVRGTVDNLMAMGTLALYHMEYALGIDNSLEHQLWYQKDVGGPSSNTFFGVPADSFYFKMKGDSKLMAMLLNTMGYTGYTFRPDTYIQTMSQMQTRLK